MNADTNNINTLQEKPEGKHEIVGTNIPKDVYSNNDTRDDVDEQQKVFSSGRSSVTSFSQQNDEINEEMKDCTTVSDEDVKNLDENVSNMRISCEEQNSLDDSKLTEGLSNESPAQVTRRLELELEELRATREAKQARLMELVREKEKARQIRLKKEEEVRNQIRLKGGIPFADPFADSFAVQEKALDYIDTEPEAQSDIHLSDLQIMQSIILAEEAALLNKPEFKTTEHLHELDTTRMLFHNKMTQHTDTSGGVGASQPIARVARLPKRAKYLVNSTIKRVFSKSSKESRQNSNIEIERNLKPMI